MNTWKKALFAGVVAASLVGCGGENGTTGTTGTTDAGSDANNNADPCVGAPSTISVSANITANTTWCTGQTVNLTQRIYVENMSTLTIQPGVTVKGANGSALVITRDSHISAVGTAAQPIVMTSSLPPGSRARADWGGLVLFGQAPINNGGANGQVLFEGLFDEARNYYGGNDAAWNCGQLAYVRVEFGGQVFATNKEFNGITFAGCGTATTGSYLQAHMGADDGLEFFGGAPNVDHVVVTASDDDGLDYDNGFSGHIQYYIVYHTEATHGDNAIEADNNASGTTAAPRSRPLVYNATFISDNLKSRKITLRRATFGVLHNVLFQDFAGGLKIEPPRTDNEASATYASHWPADLVIQNSFFFNSPVTGPVLTATGDLPTTTVGCAGGAASCPDTSVQGTFDQLTLVSQVALNNTVAAGAAFITVGSATAPNFVPGAGVGAIAAGSQGSAPAGWATFDSAGLAFAGAVAPGATGAAIWYNGWTSFPAN